MYLISKWALKIKVLSDKAKCDICDTTYTTKVCSATVWYVWAKGPRMKMTFQREDSHKSQSEDSNIIRLIYHRDSFLTQAYYKYSLFQIANTWNSA